MRIGDGLGERAVDAERDARGAAAAARDREARVAVALAHRPQVADAGPGDEQAHAWVAVAERAEARELLGDIVAEALAADDGVDNLGGTAAGIARAGGRAVLREGALKCLDAVRLDLQPGGGTVSAVAGQVLAAGIERAEQVEARDAATRARARARRRARSAPPVCRWRSAMREATIPTTPACQPSPGKRKPGGLGQLFGELRAAPLGRRERLALDLAALVVGAVELGCDLRRARVVGA